MKFLATLVIFIAFIGTIKGHFYLETMDYENGTVQNWVTSQTQVEPKKFAINGEVVEVNEEVRFIDKIAPLECMYASEEYTKNKIPCSALQTSTPFRYYASSSKNFKKPIVPGETDIYFTFIVQNGKNLLCADNALKLLYEDVDQSKFNQDTPYFLKFGINKCMTSENSYEEKLIFEVVYNGYLYKLRSDKNLKLEQGGQMLKLTLLKSGEFKIHINGELREEGTVTWNMYYENPVDKAQNVAAIGYEGYVFGSYASFSYINVADNLPEVDNFSDYAERTIQARFNALKQLMKAKNPQKQKRPKMTPEQMKKVMAEKIKNAQKEQPEKKEDL